MSAAPFVVIVQPNRQHRVKRDRIEFYDAYAAEKEAARLRSFGFSAYEKATAHAKPPSSERTQQ